jgi:hypothetical protein
MNSPVFCIGCKAAFVRDASPIAYGWSWSACSIPRGWFCPECTHWEDETEPNVTPEWLAFDRSPERAPAR